jgi:hypothetical protein
MTTEEMAIKIYAELSGNNEPTIRYYYYLKEEGASSYEALRSREFKPVINSILQAVELERERCVKLAKAAEKDNEITASTHSGLAVADVHKGIAHAMNTLADRIYLGKEAE